MFVGFVIHSDREFSTLSWEKDNNSAGICCLTKRGDKMKKAEEQLEKKNKEMMGKYEIQCEDLIGDSIIWGRFNFLMFPYVMLSSGHSMFALLKNLVLEDKTVDEMDNHMIR